MFRRVGSKKSDPWTTLIYFGTELIIKNVCYNFQISLGSRGPIFKILQGGPEFEVTPLIEMNLSMHPQIPLEHN